MVVTIVELLWKVSCDRDLGPSEYRSDRFRGRGGMEKVKRSNTALICAGDSRQYVTSAQLCCGCSAHVERGRDFPRRVPAWRARPDPDKPTLTSPYLRLPLSLVFHPVYLGNLAMFLSSVVKMRTIRPGVPGSDVLLRLSVFGDMEIKSRPAPFPEKVWSR